ncbi:MAG: TIGR03618 family F420-dependent PPOX class oxidoreductase [Actinobacteria bacterium]|nr:MAG: TIGR03618 family F420-dependent PPOX class oxidoreductase [Actinomycetota bacterium]
MRKNLTPDDLGDLLEQPLVAVLATYRLDGGVLLSPVWHRWRDGGFDVATGRDDVKVRHLRRDPRASIVVYEHVPPYRGIEVRGDARLEPAGDAVRQIAIRYLGERDGAAYADSAGDDTLIRLEPGRLRAWDFADQL